MPSRKKVRKRPRSRHGGVDRGNGNDICDVGSTGTTSDTAENSLINCGSDKAGITFRCSRKNPVCTRFDSTASWLFNPLIYAALDRIQNRQPPRVYDAQRYIPTALWELLVSAYASDFEERNIRSVQDIALGTHDLEYLDQKFQEELLISHRSKPGRDHRFNYLLSGIAENARDSSFSTPSKVRARIAHWFQTEDVYGLNTYFFGSPVACADTNRNTQPAPPPISHQNLAASMNTSNRTMSSPGSNNRGSGTRRLHKKHNNSFGKRKRQKLQGHVDLEASQPAALPLKSKTVQTAYNTMATLSSASSDGGSCSSSRTGDSSSSSPGSDASGNHGSLMSASMTQTTNRTTSVRTPSADTCSTPDSDNQGCEGVFKATAAAAAELAEVAAAATVAAALGVILFAIQDKIF